MESNNIINTESLEAAPPDNGTLPMDNNGLTDNTQQPPPSPRILEPTQIELNEDTRRDSLNTENRAPGIPDRRKSLRPSPDRSPRGRQRGGKRRSIGIPIRVSMAEAPADLKVKEDDERSVRSSRSDTFEDAVDTTPRPTTQDVDVPGGFDAPESQNEKADETAEQKDGNGGLDGANSASHSRAGSALVESAPNLPAPATSSARDRSESPAKSPRQQPQGLLGDLPSVEHAPPLAPTGTRPDLTPRMSSSERTPSVGASPQPREGLARSVSRGFGGFLARATSIRKSARSPTGPRSLDRRNTGASVTSAGESGNTLAAIVDNEDGAQNKPSLQDQFKSLRQKGEQNPGLGAGGIAPETDTAFKRTSSDAGLSSAPIEPVREDAEQSPERSASTPGLLKSPPLNPSLPPGTASGLTAGPHEEAAPVNWDLWQSVVQEGPAAVARTSGEELRRSIAAGIPPAIRGVIWQVLAESKSDDLENMYRTLKARGTEAEHKPSMSRTESNAGVSGAGGTGNEESINSSRSSTHSVGSTKATPASSPPPSVDGNVNPAERPNEVQAKLLAEKQKREQASLAKLEKAIKRDLGSRTSYSKYTQSAGLQDGLFGVCKAYALFDEAVGYAQGMNFIAMPLLFNMSEEEAFSLLVRLMNKHDLRSMFTTDMPGLHLRLYQFERILEDLEPALYCHLKRRHVGPHLYATQWFLTLFAYRFPLQLVLRVYDLILSEGLTAVLKFGIVLLQKNRETLLTMKDMSHLTTFLKERVFDVYIDKTPSASSLLDSGFFGSVTGGADRELYRADELVRDACSIALADETLATYTLEWEEQQRSEKATADELESLRASNTQLISQVKSLESRAQQFDSEHASLATEVVHTKVANEALLDANEGLKVQVSELQKMVESQPEEVEARLKEEMERIIGRNGEVQNENRMLKEEMDEMERELVGVKMSCAQVSFFFSSFFFFFALHHCPRRWSLWLRALVNRFC